MGRISTSECFCPESLFGYLANNCKAAKSPLTVGKLPPFPGGRGSHHVTLNSEELGRLKIISTKKYAKFWQFSEYNAPRGVSYQENVPKDQEYLDLQRKVVRGLGARHRRMR
jgi:hypothetical protein